MCKWTGWSLAELRSVPERYIEVIATMMQEEADALSGDD
jgi:hypothetical protein